MIKTLFLKALLPASLFFLFFGLANKNFPETTNNITTYFIYFASILGALISLVTFIWGVITFSSGLKKESLRKLISQVLLPLFLFFVFLEITNNSYPGLTGSKILNFFFLGGILGMVVSVAVLFWGLISLFATLFEKN